MNDQLRIEHYLSQLDRELGAMSLSERAEIVTEIKSHIFESKAAHPEKPIQKILEDLGTPRATAQRYLVSKGLPLAPRKKGRVFKWVAIGTVAFFGLIFVGGIAAVWYLSPVVSIDGERGRVKLLGGLVDIDEDIGQVRFGNIQLNESMGESIEIKGDEALEGRGVKSIRIPFNTARLVIKPSPDGHLSWDCDAAPGSGLAPEISAGIMTLNLDQLNIVRCTIFLPAGAPTQIRGVNGHMDVQMPANDVDININNGNVRIRPAPSVVYDFDVKVKNGLQDFFPRSSDKHAVKVKVNVTNGLVKKE